MAIAPIENDRWFTESPLPILFAEGVRIDTIPKWVYSGLDSIQIDFTNSQRIKGSRNAFQVEYSADAIGTPDPDDTKTPPRDIQTAKHEAIFLANLALWISNPNAVSYSAIIHYENVTADPLLRQYASIQGFKAHGAYLRRKLEHSDFELARSLHSQLSKLNRRGPVWLAAYSLWLGLHERDWASRFMQMWIALEALFGPDDAREITFRLSQRISFFLEPNKEKAFDLFKHVKASYSWRSKIVHGLKLSKLEQDESEVLSYSLEHMVAGSLRKILSDSKLIDFFDGSGREDFLDKFAFT